MNVRISVPRFCEIVEASGDLALMEIVRKGDSSIDFKTPGPEIVFYLDVGEGYRFDRIVVLLHLAESNVEVTRSRAANILMWFFLWGDGHIQFDFSALEWGRT